jgi:hypothetical protein
MGSGRKKSPVAVVVAIIVAIIAVIVVIAVIDKAVIVIMYKIRR